VLTYFSISSWTKADMNVETLEELRQTSAHSSVPARKSPRRVGEQSDAKDKADIRIIYGLSGLC